MKRLIPLLLLLLSFSASAQNYSCFVPDTVQYYVNNGNYVRGIRIDSVKTVGTDIVYYPFKTPRGYYENFATLDSNGGSWVGSKVIQQANGTTLFDNYWGDTIFINTHALLGDQWTFYQHPSSQYSYKAQVTAVSMMSFLGFTDSVKKITITSYDGINVNTTDSLDGFEILLSKSHGFVQTFDMYMFPYHHPDSVYMEGRDYFVDMSVSSVGGNFLFPRKENSIFYISDYNYTGNDDQYNWNVGDVHQYSWHLPNVGQWPNNFTLDTITQVNYSGSSPRYVTKGWSANWGFYNQNYCYNTTTYSQDSSINNWMIHYQVNFTEMPEEHGQMYSLYYLPFDNSYCVTGPRYSFRNIPISFDMVINTFEPDVITAVYKQGLGLVHIIDYVGGTIGYTERELVYYNRNGNICGGVTQWVNVAETGKDMEGLSLYPNPASDELIIDAPVVDYNVSIVNTLGQTVYTKQDCNRKQTINTSSLTSGIYYLELEASEHTTVNKKIVIQH